jgi:cell division protein FtsZ
LDYATAHKKIYIGRALTRGLGAGMNPEIGKQAAEENRSEIGEALEGADMVFITAGMGGGTGTSGSAVIAEIAKEKGILTVAVVTKPFAFEGAQRMNIAQEGLSRLKEKVDALVIIPNDRIFSLIDKDTPILKAFSFIDDVLKQAVQAITELVNTPGIINVDFADVKTVLKDAGTTLIGIGTASGQDRSIKAVNEAVTSPLLEVSLDGAKGIVFSIAGTKDLKMSEINEIAKAISANLDANARVIFGAYHDRSLKDKALKVTVIATGFNGVFPQRMMPTLFMAGESPKKDIKTEQNQEEEEKDGERVPEGREKNSRMNVQKPDKNEPWEIPTFLRKKKK